MPVPALLPTAAREETFAGLTYHIEGELVPVLHVEVKSANVYFEHHILLWKDPISRSALNRCRVRSSESSLACRSS